MFNKLRAYFFGKTIATFTSPYSGQLEVVNIRGRNVLNSQNANLSHAGLHLVFQNIFKTIKLKSNPPQKVLLLGLAGGSVPYILYDELNLHCKIDAVEYDRVMIDIANTYFDIGRFKNLTVHHADAYQFVQTATPGYDLIIVDLFNDNVIPELFFDEVFNGNLLRLLGKGKIIFNTMVIDKQSARNVTRLKDFYRLRDGVKTQNYFPNGDNEVLVVEKV